MLNKFLKKKKGFTLLETLFAVFLATLFFSALFGLISQSLRTISLSDSKFFAAYLVQEGLEIVRNIRDTNFLKQQPWDQGLPETITGPLNLDYLTTSLPDSRCSLTLKFNGSFFSCEGTFVTKFNRKVFIRNKEDLNGDSKADKLEVEVVVEWLERGQLQNVSAKTFLYNWRQ
jgi:type II secretory pathway pseudopilin PulG